MMTQSSLRFLRCSSEAMRKLTCKSVCTHCLLGDFKRLSLGGYGGLRYIKSIWVNSPGPGDQIPRSVVSNSNVYSREGDFVFEVSQFENIAVWSGTLWYLWAPQYP